MTTKPTIFFDRDGVLIRDKRYTYKPKDIELVKDCQETLEKLKAAGFLVFVITNQSGVARNFYSVTQVIEAHKTLQNLLGPKASIDEFYVCTHIKVDSPHPHAKDCECRKPGTALLEIAFEKHPIDKSRTWLVGDRKSDIDCAKNFGIGSIQYVNSQYELHKNPDHSIKSLSSILEIVGA